MIEDGWNLGKLGFEGGNRVDFHCGVGLVGVWRGIHENPKPLTRELLIEAKGGRNFLRDLYS